MAAPRVDDLARSFEAYLEALGGAVARPVWGVLPSPDPHMDGRVVLLGRPRIEAVSVRSGWPAASLGGDRRLPPRIIPSG